MLDKREEEFNALMGRISSHLPADKVEQLRGIFTESPQAALLVGEEVLAKSDYTRRVQQVAAQQQQLQAEQAKLTELSGKINEYDAYLRTSHVSREDYDSLAAERARLQTAFEQLSQEYPSIVDDLSLPTSTSNSNSNPSSGANVMPTPTSGNPSNPSNPVKSVSELQWNQDKQSLAALAMLSPAAQHDLAVKHQQLFGSQIGNMTEIVQEAANTGRSLEEVWGDKYNVSARMEEVKQAEINSLVEERTKAELAKMLSAGAVGGGVGVPNTNIGSPFLQRLAPADGQPSAALGAPDMNRVANQGTGQGSAAQAATAAYLQGKYKNERFDMLNT